MSSAGRVLIIPKGEYSNSIQYQMLDSVRYNGSLYIAKKTTMGHIPQDGEYWMLSATGANWGDISGDITTQTDLMTLLNGKEDTLTFDTTPTVSSLNPVTSGGIKTALDTKMPNPSGGVAGDVLIKTATGVDWDTLSASDVALGTGTLEDLAGSVATIELSPTLNTYATGDFLVWNGVLYKVIAPIDAGENLVVGTNISAVNVGSELTTIHNDITSLNNDLASVNTSISSLHGGVPKRSMDYLAPGESLTVTFASDFSANSDFALVCLNLGGNAIAGVELLFLGRGTSKIKAFIGSMATSSYTASYNPNTWTITNNTAGYMYYTAIITR